jgi:uncharacterized protein YqgV (UPF0045/DUF77 family)
MTVFGMLRVTPVTDEDITEEVAAAIDALEDHDVEYETNPMSTVLEAETVDDLLAAVGAAHEAVPGDHVETLLQIDDRRDEAFEASEKTEKVEEALGREAHSDRE